MGEETIIFGDIEIEKHTFHRYKSSRYSIKVL